MKVVKENGKFYKLPSNLNKFQKKMYIRLINFKWEEISKKPGIYRNNEYDAFLPSDLINKNRILFEGIRKLYEGHKQEYDFKEHLFFNHVASSQAACINLFFPILQNPKISNLIFSLIKTDFKAIDNKQLFEGYKIEYWGDKKSLLNDHNKATGTDADIAISYRNKKGKLCLWLIEHKLTENDFTKCGGARSKGRNKSHNCSSCKDILNDLDLCYYHSKKGYKYWEIAKRHNEVFNKEILKKYTECPFKKGTNQLWRNMLLALAIEDDKEMNFEKVYFSVVYHPDNKYLEKSMNKFRELIGNNERFSFFKSEDIIKSAEKINNEINDKKLGKWISWYKRLYLFND